MKKYDYLIVGAGLYGAVFAQKAREADKKVVVAENAKPTEKPKKGKVKTDA